MKMIRKKRERMPGNDKLEEMLQEGWKIVSTYGYGSLVLAKGEIRRLVNKIDKHVIVEYHYK